MEGTSKKIKKNWFWLRTFFLPTRFTTAVGALRTTKTYYYYYYLFTTYVSHWLHTHARATYNKKQNNDNNTKNENKIIILSSPIKLIKLKWQDDAITHATHQLRDVAEAGRSTAILSTEYCRLPTAGQRRPVGPWRGKRTSLRRPVVIVIGDKR